MRTYATMLTGGDGFGIGATAAGLRPTWGVEIDGQIADWAERNSRGLAVIRSDVADVDYSTLETPFQLHVSPQCKNASQASSGEEAKEDVSQAAAIKRAIKVLLPPVFTLENVWAYRHFQSFTGILKSLHQAGYAFKYWHLNAADFGVPQTRKRLILIARRDGLPVTRPEATHAERPAASFFGSLEPWGSWYQAIEDLIPGLPESEFAPWQLKRLPEKLKDIALFSVGISRDHKGNEYDSTYRQVQEPGFTVTGNSNQGSIRAYLVQGQNARPNDATPIFRNGSVPAPTLTNQSKGFSRAFLVGSQYGQSKSGGKHGDQRAYISEYFDDEKDRYIRETGIVPGYRIVKMTPRALARFQSFPDWYELPDKADPFLRQADFWKELSFAKTLACTIIGNAVPPLLAQRIVEAIK